jgi:hypothetical protein
VLHWCRFLGAKSEQELEQLATMDPHLRQAKDALERLSADPVARELARERELAVWNHERGVRLARAEGREEGERSLLRMLLRQRFGELPPSAEARLAQAHEADLARWAGQLLTATSIDEAIA